VSVDNVRDREGKPSLRALAIRDTLRSAPQLFSGRMISVLSAWGEISDEEAARLLAKQEKFLADSVSTYANNAPGFAAALELFRGG
jgi:hypothetical protein